VASPQSKNKDLNAEQCHFLACALMPPGRSGTRSLPVLLWGPPGTGKTTTLVKTIATIVKKQPQAKVLVCTPSNPASDLLCERLAGEGLTRSQMLRLVAVTRNQRDIAGPVRQFTRMNETYTTFEVPKLKELMKMRVIVCTCTTASYIRSSLQNLESSWFTHVFVDEAAQAMEAEVLVPLTLRQASGRFFLAGDFKQLGAVIRSPVALKYGLEISLMERIVGNLPGGVDHSRVFTLLNTYRSHPSILQLYNKTVYGNVLKSFCPSSSFNFEQWSECPTHEGKKHPVILHHCNGQESRTKESPSWQNTSEADIVKQYVGKLLAFGIAKEDIGIISPYHKQVQLLRRLCQGEDADMIDVGTTELFQGCEKQVIIISTVRSRQQNEIGNDFRFALGFLGSFKRTNVAISRAKALLIVVGNLTLLSNDHTWNEVVKLARSNGCCKGSSFKLKQARFGERSQWGDGLGVAQAGSGDGVADRPWRDYH